MAYNPNWPLDSLAIADIPAVFREIAKQLIQEQIVDAGLLGGKPVSDFVLLSGLNNMRLNPPFVVNGTFTVPQGVTTVYVSMCGGGGAGSTAWPCGGGGAECVYRKAVAVTPGEEIEIIIGNGGLAGYGPYSTPLGNLPAMMAAHRMSGTDGQSSKFGNYIECKGGKGAFTSATSCYPGDRGGNGGLPGEMVLLTADEGASVYHRNFANGGSTIFGQGGTGGFNAAGTAVNAGVVRGGYNGIGNGSGGGGAADASDGYTYYATGAGNGAPGICIVEW